MHLSDSARLLSFTLSNFTNKFKLISAPLYSSLPLLYQAFSGSLLCLLPVPSPTIPPTTSELFSSNCVFPSHIFPLPSSVLHSSCLSLTLSVLFPPEVVWLFYSCLNRDGLLCVREIVCVCVREFVCVCSYFKKVRGTEIEKNKVVNFKKLIPLLHHCFFFFFSISPIKRVHNIHTNISALPGFPLLSSPLLFLLFFYLTAFYFFILGRCWCLNPYTTRAPIKSCFEV